MARKKRKRFTREKNNKIVAGVLSGASEYFDMDITLLRIVYILGTALTGFVTGMVVYALIVMVVPQK